MRRTKYKMKGNIFICIKNIPLPKIETPPKKKSQVNKQHTTILLTIANTGNKGKGRRGDLSYTDPRFSFSTYTSMLRVGTKSINTKTFIYIF